MGNHKNIADQFKFREDPVGISKAGAFFWAIGVCIILLLSVEASAFDLFQKKDTKGVAVEKVQTLSFPSADGEVLFRREVIDFARVDWKALTITYMHWTGEDPKRIGSDKAATREELQKMIDVVFPGIRKVR